MYAHRIFEDVFCTIREARTFIDGFFEKPDLSLLDIYVNLFKLAVMLDCCVNLFQSQISPLNDLRWQILKIIPNPSETMEQLLLGNLSYK